MNKPFTPSQALAALDLVMRGQRGAFVNLEAPLLDPHGAFGSVIAVAFHRGAGAQDWRRDVLPLFVERYGLRVMH